jgi:DNA-binding NarL/FixJ family response regulator
VIDAADEAWAEEIRRFTARELAVLDGVIRSLAPREIAGALSTTESTVKSAIASLICKFGASDLTAATVAAIRHGFVDLSGHLPPHDPIPHVETPVAN